MSGELIGMDAINTGQYMCDAVALEDSSVCAIPFAELECVIRDIPALQRYLHRTMSAKSRMTTGSCCCSAACAPRSGSRCFWSACQSATRARLFGDAHQFAPEAGGNRQLSRLKLETVSRVLSRFQQSQLITVEHKDVEIKDLDRLNRMVGDHHDVRQRAPRQALRAAVAAPVPVQPDMEYA